MVKGLIDKRNIFKELAYPHMRFLYNVALKYMRNQYDAEDLVQETMYAAFRNFHQLRDQSKCRSWLLLLHCIQLSGENLQTSFQ